MRIPSLLPGLLILPLGMFGCSQTWGLRNGPSDDVKTVASVGDKPLPIRSGTPDSSVRAEETEPIIPPPSRGRISGRVYDERGKPVPNARVRLAVGGEAGGKAVSAITDRSGAFTLRGLRPGSSYTVIADYQGQNGLMTGRVDTEAPDANVRIGLQRRTADLDEVRTSIRPARPGVEPISNVEEADESEDAGESSPRTNREDIEPPAPEAEPMKGVESQLSPPVSAAGESAGRSTGWTQGHRSADRPGAGQSGTGRSRSTDGPSPVSRSPQGIEGEDDEENPLPPALELEKVGSNPDPQDGAKRSIVLAQGRAASPGLRRRTIATGTTPEAEADPAPDPDEDPSSPDRSTTQPLPQGVVAGARTVSPDAYAPIMMSDPDVSRHKPPRSPGRASRDVQSPSASREPRSAPAVAPSERSRPTWGELVFQKQPIPLDESLQKVSRDIAVKGPRSGPADGPKAAAMPPALGLARPAALSTKTAVACLFDPTERRLQDFQLPDALGRMVSFYDFDADLILLDFWGTWCAPCRKSIPHLIEIQQTLGGKKMQVIGIACERTPPKDRAARVAQTVKQLKINYPVLISSMDGTCPVQDAFQIQFYPTMVLLDRRGRVLWREQGATDVTLARMDRFIVKNLNRSEATGEDSLQARLARSKN